MYADSISFEDSVLATESVLQGSSLSFPGPKPWDVEPVGSDSQHLLRDDRREVKSQLTRWHKGGMGRVAWHFPFEGTMERTKAVILPFPWVDGRPSRTKGRGIWDKTNSCSPHVGYLVLEAAPTSRGGTDVCSLKVP